MKAGKFVVSVTLGVGLSAALVVPIAFTGAGLSGCCLGGGGAATPGLVVTVTDGPGGAAICDATVTAIDRGFSADLMRGGSQPDCVYTGAYPGTYNIEI